MIFFIPSGVYYIARYYEKNSSRLIFIWLLISPIPASITADVPSPSRVLSMVIPIVIIVASGMFSIYKNIGNRRIIRYLYISTITLFLVFSSIKYFHQYDIYLPYERSKDWVYGRKELVDYVEANKVKYKKIIISTSLEWPHIFFLYYSKYDPALVQKTYLQIIELEYQSKTGQLSLPKEIALKRVLLPLLK